MSSPRRGRRPRPPTHRPMMLTSTFSVAEPRLGKISVPTLIVLGERDVEPIADIGRRYAQGIRGARLVTLAPADHLLPLRVPDQLHPLLLEHLG